MQKIETNDGIVHLEFINPTRGLFGYRREFMTDTRGLGIMNTLFYQYLPEKGEWKERDRGSLVAYETGITRLYGLTSVQDRGELFYGPGNKVYKSQVIGQNSRSEDIWVNVCKEKQLSNMRSKGEGVMEHFNTPKIMSLENSLEYIDDTELVEVTPKSVRMRKIVLDKVEERRRLNLLKRK